MSFDGKYMLIGNLNLRNNNIGELIRVRMDGEEEETLLLPKRHHDFTVLPNSDTIAIVEYDDDGIGTCDRLIELAPDGEKRLVYALRDDFGHREADEEWCHTNAVNYVPDEDAYYLSVLKMNAILKIDRASGTLVWVLGGEDSTFDGASWHHQHQHQLLDNGNILLFSNGAGGFSEADQSVAIEYALDNDTLIATETWRYQSGLFTSSLGDVQRVGNGNTLITYSNSGTIHEVDTATASLLAVFESNPIVGYAIRRDALYGPPQAYR
jgi:hypothetical protein